MLVVSLVTVVVIAWIPTASNAFPFAAGKGQRMQHLSLQHGAGKHRLVRRHDDTALPQFVGNIAPVKTEIHASADLEQAHVKGHGVNSKVSTKGWREARKRARSNDGIPGLFEALASLPVMEQNVRIAKPTKRRIAVCMTGHLRTFSMLGVHSSYAHNLMRSTAEVQEAHLYLYGHLGRFNHDWTGWGWEQGMVAKSPVNETDPSLRKALAYPGLNLKYVEIHKTGDDAEYVKLEAKDGRASKCGGSEIQFCWLDRCVRKVLASEHNYDLVVRTRPDVGICKPMPWGNISSTHISYIRRHVGNSGEDWFFTIPSQIITSQWETLAYTMKKANDALFRPDGIHIASSILERANDNMPVTVVRSPFSNGSQAKCKSFWPGFRNWNISEAKV